MNDTDRVRLAEAMGYTHDEWGNQVDGKRVFHFQPENDANDDYAVLEWMREYHDENDCSAADSSFELTEKMLCDYQIGDYARAALKVLDDDSQ